MRRDGLGGVAPLQEPPRLEEQIDDQEQPHLDRQDEEEEHLAAGVVQGIEHHDRQDRPQGADHGHAAIPMLRVVGQGPAEGAEDRRAEVHRDEVATAVHRLHLAADHPEEEHVEQEVERILRAVQEGRRQELPDAPLLENPLARRRQPMVERPARHHLEDEDDDVDEDDRLARRRQPGEPPGTTRLATIVLAVIDSHERLRQTSPPPSRSRPGPWPIHLHHRTSPRRLSTGPEAASARAKGRPSATGILPRSPRGGPRRGGRSGASISRPGVLPSPRGGSRTWARPCRAR